MFLRVPSIIVKQLQDYLTVTNRKTKLKINVTVTLAVTVIFKTLSNVAVKNLKRNCTTWEFNQCLCNAMASEAPLNYRRFSRKNIYSLAAKVAVF